jgi:hypothetical protein
MPNDARALSRPAPACRVVDWKPWPLANPALAGHASFEFAGCWTAHQCPVFRGRNGALSVGTPSIPLLDGEARARVGPDGERQYLTVVTFASASARSHWRDMTAAALAEAGVVP